MAKCKMCGEVLLEDEENFCIFCQSAWDTEESLLAGFDAEAIAGHYIFAGGTIRDFAQSLAQGGAGAVYRSGWQLDITGFTNTR